MSIDVKQLVDIQSRTIGGGLAGLEMNGVLLSSSSLIPAKTTLQFSSSESVGDYFGLSSEEYTLATKYFLADDNKQKSPSALYFFRFIKDAVAGWIRGGTVSVSVNSIAAITDGSFKIIIDGAEKAYSGIDFTGLTSFSAIATKLQTVIDADATIEYNANFKSFIITSPTTGADSSVGYASSNESGTDLSSILGLTENDGAILSVGCDATTPAENMTNLIKDFKNFVSFMPVFQEDADTKQALSVWTNTQGVRFVYMANETSANALIANNDVCFAQTVSDYFGIFNGYNTKDFLAFVMGFVSSIDWNRLNGRKTLAYKSQAGLTPTCEDSENAIALLGNGYNFYGAYATASEEFSLAQNGQISGPVKWLDTYLGQIWLRCSLQAGWVSVMKNANILPFNNRGYGQIYAGSLDVINQAKSAGIIVEGVNLSNAQKSQVNQEAGEDISEALYTQGWYLQIVDADTQTRVNRGPLKVNFWYCDGGSIQKIEGSSSTIL